MQWKIASVLPLLIYFCALSRHCMALNKEGLVLREVKLALSDPDGALAGWSDRDPTPCKWVGITCDGDGSVVTVDLTDASLAGPLSPAICRLPSLSNLSLSYNYINGSLPLSISACRKLVYLDLSMNLLYGPLPPSLADLPILWYLNLASNNFGGDIPAAFGRFKRLETLSLTNNLLNGTIPAALGNITALKSLQLAYNPFTPGHIPDELGNLTNLQFLWLTQCHLVGPIPESLRRLTQLQNLDLSMNELSGPIPGHMFTDMTRIVQIELYNNSLSGTLPAGWSNVTMLRRIDASMNQLTGVIPLELCELPLESLALYENQLEGRIPDSIALSPNLYGLTLFKNRLTGELPRDLGKNAPLQVLDVTSNHLSGEIPKFLCKNGKLEIFILMNNAFTGTIPTNLEHCRSLLRVRLKNNMLQGEVPPHFWGLPHLFFLELSGNGLSGTIPSLIGGAKNLSTFVISNNRFSGSIPSEIGLLHALINFAANGNSFGGEIPSTIWNLKQLGSLDLSNNEISGVIPTGIQSLKLLDELNLANNHFSGHIPDELGNLPVLTYLDLSNNSFSGKIPASLQNLKLNKLNLSSNMLSGGVPPLFASGAYRDSFLGNRDLCLYNSDACNRKVEKKHRFYSSIETSIIVILGLAFLAGTVWFQLRHRKLKQMAEAVAIAKWTSFHKLGFSELEISNSLKETNVIGRGASGKVYKVVLSNLQPVAVKKLHQYSNPNLNNPHGANSCEFEVEVDTLGKIRHKNIVKLLCCCCDAGNCKLLVYEYMPHGSLFDVLHGSKSEALDWPMRFNILLGAAEGLSYLHHDCDPPIVHRDVKSNNLLLDENFEVKISDFGVAKVVKAIDNGVESMSIVAGSCGYIAPEYAYTMRVNEKSDIYSFGIVILELVTRRLPTDPTFGCQDLAAWVCKTLDREGPNRVLDPALDSRFNTHICRVLDIGLDCANRHPTNRPSMRSVVAMLRELGVGMPPIHKEKGSLLP